MEYVLLIMAAEETAAATEEQQRAQWPKHDAYLRELNRAVAVAEVAGPAAGLTLLDGVDLPGFHLLPSTRADLLRRLAGWTRHGDSTRRRSGWPATPPTATSSPAA